MKKPKRKSKVSARIRRRGYHVVNEMWKTYSTGSFICYEMDLKTKRGAVSTLVEEGSLIVALSPCEESVGGVRDDMTVIVIRDQALTDKWQVITGYISKYHVTIWLTSFKRNSLPKPFYSRKV
jgi:hypothetical protein